MLLCLVFLCVVLHEYGHAIAARYYDVPIRDILILPIGGLARLEFIPQSPSKEMVIAISGPLVNLLLMFLFGSAYFFLETDPQFITQIDQLTSGTGLLFGLAMINFTLFLFNLIPAYPMDGGRILRAGLSQLQGRYQATITASYIAQLIACGFVIAGGTLPAMTLLLIGAFIFLTARWERNMLIRSRREEEE